MTGIVAVVVSPGIEDTDRLTFRSVRMYNEGCYDLLEDIARRAARDRIGEGYSSDER